MRYYNVYTQWIDETHGITILHKDGKSSEIHWVSNSLLIPAGFNFIGTDKDMNTYLSKNLRNWVRVISANAVTQGDEHNCNLNECMYGHDCDECDCKIKGRPVNTKSILPFPEADPFNKPDEMVNSTESKPTYFFYTTEVVGIIARWLYELDDINQFTKKPVHYKFINEIILKCTEYFNEKANGKPFFPYDKPCIDDEIEYIIFKSDFKDYFTALNISYIEAQHGVTVKDREEEKESKTQFVGREMTPPWQDGFIDLYALQRNICNDINRQYNLSC